MALVHCSSPLPPSIISFNNSTSNSVLYLRPTSRHFARTLPSIWLNASLAVESPAISGANSGGESSKLLLEVKDLTAVVAESEQPILKGVNLTVYEGQVHAVMGKNGSGKSTLAKVLVGHKDYEVTGGSIVLKGENLLDMEPEDRSIAGLFMSFQSPIEIPGFYSYIMPKPEFVNIKPDFLNRNVNEGFSGGEKKRNEILQLAVLGAELAILDEIDSGLDVDALRDVAKAVNGLLTPRNSVLMITHYLRLLEYIKPNYIHNFILWSASRL